jgi:hypothetical protein
VFHQSNRAAQEVAGLDSGLSAAGADCLPGWIDGWLVT